jgi:hypothetical protein
VEISRPVRDFHIPCGNLSGVSIGTSFPQPSSPFTVARPEFRGYCTLAGWLIVVPGASYAVVFDHSSVRSLSRPIFSMSVALSVGEIPILSDEKALSDLCGLPQLGYRHGR